MLYLRSLFFTIWVYGGMVVLGILGAPFAIWSRAGAYKVMRLYVRFVKWSLRVFIGLTCEVRGTPPVGDVLIAAKHQSFLDIMLIFETVPQAKFVMKRAVMWTPIIGLYALRIGANPVTRGKGRKSVDEMMRGVEANRKKPGQLIIYPQGTRVPPRTVAPYKRGAQLIYETYQMPCVPVAVNAGHFWPKSGIPKYAGVTVVQFLDPLPAGLDSQAFMTGIEEAIEPASEALAKEAEQFGR
ncbi:MAG: lysophospholipid acyltransferase family protein [Pikeienuella sp.]